MQGCACRIYLQRRPHEEPRRRSRQRMIDGCPQLKVAETSDLPERSCAAYLKLRCVVEASPAAFIKVHPIELTCDMTMSSTPYERVGGLATCRVVQGKLGTRQHAGMAQRAHAAVWLFRWPGRAVWR